MPLTLVARPLPELAIIVPRSLYAKVVKELVECGCIHPVGEGSQETRTVARRLRGEVELLLGRVRETLSRIGMVDVEEAVVRLGPELDKAITSIVSEINSFVDNVEKIVTRLVEYTSPSSESSRLIALLQLYGFLEVDLEALRRSKWVRAVVARIEAERLEGFQKEVLEKLEGEAFIISLEGLEKDYSLIVLLYPAWREEEVSSLLREYKLQLLEIPEGLPPSPAEAVKAISKMLEELPREAAKYAPKLREAELALASLSSLLRIFESTVLSKSIAILQGYVDSGRIDELNSRLEKVTGGAYIIASRKRIHVEAEHPVPTEFKYPSLLKPIADLITTYGHPGPLEIVPLALTTITLPVIFGLMFPDMGHGLVLLLAGIFLYYRTSMKSLGQLAVYLSIPAMVFGFLSGEFFGADPRLAGWISAFWESMGMQPPYESPVHPLVAVISGGEAEVDHVGVLVMRTIFLALTLGSGLLALASWLGVASALLRREREELVASIGRALSFTGIFVIFGCSALYGGGLQGYNMLSRVLPLATFLPISVEASQLDILIARTADVLILAGLGTMFLAPALFEKGESISMRILSGMIEVFDLLLLLMGNTASFVRIMGLMLAHSGLMFGFLVLSVSTGNIVAWAIIYLLGNILVIGLEALIASAHTLRLHFYEMYSKFYRGGGLAYAPAALPERVRIILS
ncbi:MAG: V-type ATPase 116kDa subunit family protein [Pyrodictiaceae archaeon]